MITVGPSVPSGGILIFKRACVALTGLLFTSGTVLTGATAASAAPSSTTCSAQGDFAICTASASFNKPAALTVTVSANPSQQVSVSWTDTCSYGSGAGSKSGSFTATAPVTRTISHPYSHPDNCIVAADAQLSGSGSVSVRLGTSKPAPTPARGEIKGYGGKCVDDNGNSAKNNAKVQIWSCSNDAAQQWTFSGGELKHGSLCLNDQSGAGNGGHVVLWSCSGTRNEIWSRTSSGEYVLKLNGLCLDDPGNSTRNGTQLDVYRCHNSSNQHWSLP